MQRMSLRFRLLAISLLGMLATAIVLVGLVLFQRGQLSSVIGSELVTLQQAETGKIAHDVYLMCRSMNDQLQLQVDANLKVAKHVVEQHGGIRLAGGSVPWTATSQAAGGATTSVSLPRMNAGGTWLGQVRDKTVAAPVVDEVTGMVGGACTIFQRMNDAGDMLRVCTNVAKSDGTRAIGTYIPTSQADGTANPVIASVLAGNTFQGRAYVVDSWYITCYDPIKDAAGRVIGMLFVGVKQDSMGSLRQGIQDIVIGKTGYVYVLGSKDDQRGKYVISQDGKRDGEVVWDSKDADGKQYIQAIVAKALATKDGQPDFVTYNWQNPDDPHARSKVAAVTYFEPWDWVIGAGAYSDDWQDMRGRVTNGLMLWLTMGAAAIVVLVFGLLAWAQSTRITGPLQQAVGFAQAVAGGDLTRRLESRQTDEVGQMVVALNQLGDGLRGIVQRVSAASDALASSSEELAAGADETGKAIQQVSMTIQEVARGAQTTMSSVDGAQENVGQTAKAIEGVSRDIEDVAAYATQAAAQGNEGKKSADDAVAIINRAAGTVQNTTQVVQSLGDKTKQIGEFIGIITGIADQTNLLALNAAIEAARAGDAGRGFAVVAEEVRKLAEESNGAAGNITKLVRAIEGEMNTALTAMTRSNEEVTSGARTVGQASQMLSEIVKGVDALNGRVQGISAAAEEINASTSEVVQAMQSVAAVAEESAAATEEVSSAAEEQTASMEEISASAATLARLAQDLQGLIAQFKL